MKITKGYKYRIYPTAHQAALIDSILGCCRFVYNHFLALRNEAWKESSESLGYVATARMLTELKRDPDFAWLSEADSMALQESLRNLDRAFLNFFQKRGRYPRFKSKHNHHQSYRTRNQSNSIRIEGKCVVLPKLSRVKFKLSREFEGRILNATVSKTPTGKYFVSLCVEEEIEPKHNAGGVIGIDVGIKDFYADSNGNAVANPKTLRKYERKLIREQRRLSRKQKGSANRAKQRIRVARVHEKIYNSRMDFLHKESTRLVSENQVIAVESLNVRGMIRNHKLAKSISDASWSRFFALLEYKAFECGSEVRKIETFYPSSQTCSCCGFKNPLVKSLKVRDWECPSCKARHSRDHNAAINILNRALSSA